MLTGARHAGAVGCLAAALATPACALPDAAGQGLDPARARVAAQCAAFWEGAGRPDRAAPFRALAAALAASAQAARDLEARLRPDMDALARDVTRDARAARLHARHAALCRGA